MSNLLSALESAISAHGPAVRPQLHAKPSSDSDSTSTLSNGSSASSPSSLDSVDHNGKPLAPETIVAITTPTVPFLKFLFDIYGTSLPLGLWITNTFESLPEPLGSSMIWEHAAWHDMVTGDIFDYRSAPCAQYPMDFETTDFLPVATDLLTFSAAGLRTVVSHRFADSSFYILERPPFVFPAVQDTPPLVPSAKGNIPSLEEWLKLWQAWDFVTLQMIPETMLHNKPIDLRHKCLFYIGHIPTFLDILVSKEIGGGPSEPRNFWTIFERGIDPHVDDPDHCHNHSEVPEKDEDWPTLTTVLQFRDTVRARLVRLYEDIATGRKPLTRSLARMLVMTHEHEGFHIETLLYMLIQRAGQGTLPPPGFATPPWEALARQWDRIPAPFAEIVEFPTSTVIIGHDDDESTDSTKELELHFEGHEFGWDNESPRCVCEVPAFKASIRPVTNGEYELFWKKNKSEAQACPKSWVMEGGQVKVRTLYGPISMDIARHWPVLASYDQLLAFAKDKGGRLPTEAELQLILDKYELGHENGGNVGFRNWHPTPSTTGLDQSGRGSNGGVWEWTSTPFDTHEGMSPTKKFVGYSTDFCDGKHHVVLGASYATIPRLGRRTVRNFYQHNYEYAWVAGRVVYDCK